MQKNLLLIIDLEKGKNKADTQSWNSAGSFKVFSDPIKPTPKIYSSDWNQNATTIVNSRLTIGGNFWEWHGGFFKILTCQKSLKHSNCYSLGLKAEMTFNWCISGAHADWSKSTWYLWLNIQSAFSGLKGGVTYKTRMTLKWEFKTLLTFKEPTMLNNFICTSQKLILLTDLRKQDAM